MRLFYEIDVNSNPDVFSITVIFFYKSLYYKYKLIFSYSFPQSALEQKHPFDFFSGLDEVHLNIASFHWLLYCLLDSAHYYY